MFLSSEIDGKFACGETKFGQFMNFGLKPHFKEELLCNIKRSPLYSILFVESMKKILQMERIDLYIRCWCDSANKLKTNYFDSQFRHRANADNIYTYT